MGAKALVIGVGTYDHLPALLGPRTDAQALEAVLSDPEISDFQVEILTDRPTKEAATRIESVLNDAEPTDTVLIYFSGHGKLDKHDEFFLCFTDTNTQSLSTTAYAWTFFRRALTGSVAARIVLILDCCHSGAAKDGALPDVMSGRAASKREKVKYRIASSLANQRSKDAEREGALSRFTAVLVQGLRDHNCDKGRKGFITVDDIKHYLKEHYRDDVDADYLADGTGEVRLVRTRGNGSAVTRTHVDSWNAAQRRLEQDPADKYALAYLRSGMLAAQLRTVIPAAKQLLRGARGLEGRLILLEHEARLERSPERAVVLWTDLGKQYLQQHEPLQAMEAFEQAFRLLPGNDAICTHLEAAAKEASATHQLPDVYAPYLAVGRLNDLERINITCRLILIHVEQLSSKSGWQEWVKTLTQETQERRSELVERVFANPIVCAFLDDERSTVIFSAQRTVSDVASGREQNVPVRATRLGERRPTHATNNDVEDATTIPYASPQAPHRRPKHTTLQPPPTSVHGRDESVHLLEPEAELEKYRADKNWVRVIATLERMAKDTSDRVLANELLTSAGVVARDELQNTALALDLFERALDCAFIDDQLSLNALPKVLWAFRHIDELHTKARNWKEQERAYRRILERLPEVDDERLVKLTVTLTDALADVYQSRLADVPKAIEALEAAQDLDSVGVERVKKLARLYVSAGESHWDKAIAANQTLIRQSPESIDAYRALVPLYKQTRQLDKLWCVCAALVFLRAADEGDVRCYRQNRPQGIPLANLTLTEDLWQLLRPTDEETAINALFAESWPALAALRAVPYKDLKVKLENERLLLRAATPIRRTYALVARTLGLTRTELYLDELPGDIRFAASFDRSELVPGFVARMSYFDGKTDGEIACIWGQRLALMRPEYGAALVARSTQEVRALAHATLAVAVEGYMVPSDLRGSVVHYAHAIRRHLRSNVEHRVRGAAMSVVSSGGFNLARWISGAETVARRSGLLMSRDINVAAATMIGGDEPMQHPRARDLLAFFASDQHFKLRSRLGLAVLKSFAQ